MWRHGSVGYQGLCSVFSLAEIRYFSILSSMSSVCFKHESFIAIYLIFTASSAVLCQRIWKIQVNYLVLIYLLFY